MEVSSQASAVDFALALENRRLELGRGHADIAQAILQGSEPQHRYWNSPDSPGQSEHSAASSPPSTFSPAAVSFLASPPSLFEEGAVAIREATRELLAAANLQKEAAALNKTSADEFRAQAAGLTVLLRQAAEEATSRLRGCWELERSLFQSSPSPTKSKLRSFQKTPLRLKVIAPSPVGVPFSAPRPVPGTTSPELQGSCCSTRATFEVGEMASSPLIFTPSDVAEEEQPSPFAAVPASPNSQEIEDTPREPPVPSPAAVRLFSMGGGGEAAPAACVARGIVFGSLSPPCVVPFTPVRSHFAEQTPEHFDVSDSFDIEAEYSAEWGLEQIIWTDCKELVLTPSSAAFGEESILSQGSYEGQLSDGLPNGYGRRLFPDGRQYEGEFRRDLYHGTGAYRLPNGDVHSGQFRDGFLHGEGEMRFASGHVYTGGFWEGFQDGYGRYCSPSHGTIYEGEFLLDQQHGQGIYRSPQDGSTYEGQWRYDMPSGRGEWSFPDGTVQKGFFGEGSFLEKDKEVDLEDERKRAAASDAASPRKAGEKEATHTLLRMQAGGGKSDTWTSESTRRQI